MAAAGQRPAGQRPAWQSSDTCYPHPSQVGGCEARGCEIKPPASLGRIEARESGGEPRPPSLTPPAIQPAHVDIAATVAAAIAPAPAVATTTAAASTAASTAAS